VTDANGTQTTIAAPRAVSPPGPGLISSGASIKLNVLSSASLAAAASLRRAGGSRMLSTAAAEQQLLVRAQAQSALTLLASTMARDAIPGDSPRSVSAGPSTAFRRAAAQARRLQGVSASADSYCGPALTLTTARISNVNNSDINPQFDVPVAEGLHPCLSSPSSARTAALIASGAGETQGRVGLSRRFIQSGTGSQLVDLQVVQMSSTFGLPEEGAFASFSYSRSGAARSLSVSSDPSTSAFEAIAALGASASLNTTVTDL
jgi:hypothetical protein